MAEKEVEIKLTKKMNLNGYTLVEGFPGIGLVGTIAVGYLAERKNSQCIGHMVSKKFPPMAIIHKGQPLFPARIYADKKRKLCYLFSEFVIPANTIYDTSSEILEWARENKIKQIVSLAGMPSRGVGEKPTIYGIASDDNLKKELMGKKVTLITEGVTSGVSGILMAKCNTEGFPAMSLLIETTHGYPDPGAAALLLKKVGEVLGIDIRTKALADEATQIESKVKKLVDQIKTGKVKYKQAEEHYPMYG
jgi:uncharacterized protein